MTTCKTSRINEVWLNATTEAVLWSRGHPAKTATITTTVDESIAEHCACAMRHKNHSSDKRHLL